MQKRARHVLAWWLVGALAALAVSASARASAGSGDAFRVIVNPDNPVTEVDRGFLRDAFLKKSNSWGSGETVRPVDLARKFPVREAFTRDVLKKTLPQLKRYWNQQIFSGKGVPPPEVDSTAAAIAYVLANPGAVGYLPADADAGRAKVVKVK
jgi:ABC-type phosphate transport system substrate-binding protein